MGDVGLFDSDLRDLGFERSERWASGRVRYSLAATPYLTYWVHWDPDREDVLFTWEIALGSYFDSLGLQVGSNEELNQFMFPKFDSRGPADVGFVAQEMDRAERILRSIDFLTAGG